MDVFPRMAEDMISRTCSEDKRFVFTLSPRYHAEELFMRFLLAASAMLSACVPSQRWSGFTHGGLSHLWSTHSPLGIDPWANSTVSSQPWPRNLQPCARGF